MKSVLVFLSLFFVSNFSFAGGFQCKDDQRSGEGVLRVLTAREDAGKYTVTYVEAGENRVTSSDEDITFIKDADCSFSEDFVGICGVSENHHYAYVKVLNVDNSVAIYATVTNNQKTLTKEIWFKRKDCLRL